MHVFNALKSTLFLCSLMMAAPATAVSLVETDDVHLSLGGWARAGLELTMPDQGPDEYALRIMTARIKSTAHYEGVGSYSLQLDAGSGTVQLVNMVLALEPCDTLTLSIGRLKTPASYEYLVSGARTEFATRTLASSVLPRRLTGAMMTWQGGLPLQLDLGAFVPGGEREVELRGPVIVARVLVTPIDAFELHVAFIQQIERPDASALPQRNYGQALDIGARVEAGAWHAHAELVAHLDDTGDEGTPLVTSFVTGYRIGTGGPDIRPVAGVDVSSEDHTTRLRARVGTDLFWAEDKVRIGVNYTMNSRTVDSAPAGSEHQLLAFGQVAF